MIRALLYWAGMLLFLVTIAVFVMEVIELRTWETRMLPLTPLGEVWAGWDISSLNGLQVALERYGGVPGQGAWLYIVLPILQVPAWLVSMILAFLLLRVGAKPRKPKLSEKEMKVISERLRREEIRGTFDRSR